MTRTRALSLAAAVLAAACGGGEFTAQTTDASVDAGAGAGGSSAGVSGSGMSGATTGGNSGSGAATGGSGDGGTGVAGAGVAGGAGEGATSGAAGASGSAGASGVAGSAQGGVSGGSGSGTGGAADAGVIGQCPAERPNDTAGRTCVDGLSCSYGDDIRWQCRDTYTCTGGAFTLHQPMCDPLASCSSLPMFPVVGQSCAPPGEQCLLSAGNNVVCTCAPCNDGSCTSPDAWGCVGAPPLPCPNSAPNRGQPCSPKGSCSYGSCATNDPMTASCDSGAWNWDFPACPPS